MATCASCAPRPGTTRVASANCSRKSRASDPSAPRSSAAKPRVFGPNCARLSTSGPPGEPQRPGCRPIRTNSPRSSLSRTFPGSPPPSCAPRCDSGESFPHVGVAPVGDEPLRHHTTDQHRTESQIMNAIGSDLRVGPAADRAELYALGRQLRVDSVRSSTAAGSGHPTSSMSAADLMAVLLARHLRYDWDDPANPANDHL